MKSLAVLALFLLGCQHTGELYVVFDSDLDPAAYGMLKVDVHDEHGTMFEQSYLLPDDARLPASLSLRARSGDPQITIDAKLYAPDRTTLLVERTAELSFVEGASRELTLRLDASCVSHACSTAGETCISGACLPDTISDDMLSSTHGNVGGPHDGGVEVDLSGPRDLAVSDGAQVEDLSYGLDFAGQDLGSCIAVPPVPSPPTGPGCVFYDFTTTRWQKFSSAVTLPSSGATLDQACPYLHIHLNAGLHDMVTNGIVRVTPRTGGAASWEMTAGYNYFSDGDGFTGVLAETASGNWWETGTTNFTGGNAYRWYERDDSDPGGTSLDSNDISPRPVFIDVTSAPLGPPQTGTGFVYSVGPYDGMGTGVSTSTDEMSFDSTQPSFFVDNENQGSSGSNEIDVELAWLSFCPGQ